MTSKQTSMTEHFLPKKTIQWLGLIAFASALIVAFYDLGAATDAIYLGSADLWVFGPLCVALVVQVVCFILFVKDLSRAPKMGVAGILLPFIPEGLTGIYGLSRVPALDRINDRSVPIELPLDRSELLELTEVSSSVLGVGFLGMMLAGVLCTLWLIKPEIYDAD